MKHMCDRSKKHFHSSKRIKTALLFQRDALEDKIIEGDLETFKENKYFLVHLSSTLVSQCTSIKNCNYIPVDALDADKIFTNIFFLAITGMLVIIKLIFLIVGLRH